VRRFPAESNAGNYKRDLYGEGEVQMKLASDGTVELTLPSPRWADSPTMKGKATFKGDNAGLPVGHGGGQMRQPAGRLHLQSDRG